MNAKKQEPYVYIYVALVAMVFTESKTEFVLYAQPIENGYQLVDSTPKVVHKLQVSGLQNVFFVEGKQAMVYKKEDVWVMEYYEDGSLRQEVLPIKF